MVDDIEKHESRVARVLTKHEELRTRTGSESPTRTQELTGEIQELKHKALKYKGELEEAVEQQIAYEEEVAELSQNIADAQERLEEAPMAASSVERLKQQIADHNVRLWWIIMVLS